MAEHTSDTTSDIREEITAYGSHPPLKPRRGMKVGDVHVRAGDVLERTYSRDSSDYYLVLACTEEDVICYWPQEDTYTVYYWQFLREDLEREETLYHPNVIK